MTYEITLKFRGSLYCDLLNTHKPYQIRMLGNSWLLLPFVFFFSFNKSGGKKAEFLAEIEKEIWKSQRHYLLSQGIYIEIDYNSFTFSFSCGAKLEHYDNERPPLTEKCNSITSSKNQTVTGQVSINISAKNFFHYNYEGRVGFFRFSS